jgi:hypothetical protein
MEVEPVSLTTQHALGHRAVVGGKHDAHGFALVGRTSGRITGGGSSQQASQERILIAHRLVADNGYLAVSRCGHKRDDPAPLEEAEDALAGALDNGLDILLGWGGRRVEDGRTVGPRGV